MCSHLLILLIANSIGTFVNRDITSNENNLQLSGIVLLERARHNSKPFLTLYLEEGMLSDMIFIEVFAQ